jgi:asparagine synthase (glutamine-hydrolysing)
MCGITGLFSKRKITQNEISLIEKMNDILKHRGPDDEGLYYCGNCVLGHRRLSIIDLSIDGHQPFFSDDKRYVLTYNGEIYNYIEIRDELQNIGWKFKTKTDTEVLMSSYLQWGSECLNRFNGMFAFAIYDKFTNNMFIARDRVGVKPFFYTEYNDTFYFASEIKALKIIPNISLSINNQAVFDYFVFNRTDIWDETFHNEIKRLPKGHYGIINKDDFKITRWWNPEDYIKNPIKIIDIHEVYNKVEELLVSSVKLRMRADVPVGSCLSGGLDSSVIAGIVASHFPDIIKKYKTFTAAFPGFDKDETAYVDILQKKYNFENFRTYPTSESLSKDLESYLYNQDDPVPGTSPYAQFKVMELAKNNNVIVLLDGQGGDENFAGYQYFHGYYLTSLLKSWRILDLFKEAWKIYKRKQEKEAFYIFGFQLLPRSIKKKVLYKNHNYLDKDFFYKYIDSSIPFDAFFNNIGLNQSIVNHFNFKLEHLLRLEDHNSMAFSIESRVPYLDYRLIEYVLSLPEEIKIKAGETKYLQKNSVGQYSIPEIVNRKDKIGFATPEKKWIENIIFKTNFNKINNVFFNKSKLICINYKIKWKIFVLNYFNNNI